MKVLLTHGYFISEDAKEQLIMRPYPPLGILYISAYLKERQVAVNVFDTTFSSVKDFKEYVQQEQPNVLAFYVNLMTKLQVIHLTKWIKGESELKHIKVIFGGPDITHNTNDYLKIGADAVVIGEGEETMYELVQSFAGKKHLSDVDGISFLNNEGVEVKTKSRTKIKEIDHLIQSRRDSTGFSGFNSTILLLAFDDFTPLSHFTATATSFKSGQEGLEPPTCGFGDRRSAN